LIQNVLKTRENLQKLSDDTAKKNRYLLAVQCCRIKGAAASRVIAAYSKLPLIHNQVTPKPLCCGETVLYIANFEKQELHRIAGHTNKKDDKYKTTVNIPRARASCLLERTLAICVLGAHTLSASTLAMNRVHQSTTIKNQKNRPRVPEPP
jgi:hypothetical protein